MRTRMHASPKIGGLTAGLKWMMQYASFMFIDHGMKVNEACCRNSCCCTLTTVPARRTSDLKRVLHLAAGQCPGNGRLRQSALLVVTFIRCWPILKILSQET